MNPIGITAAVCISLLFLVGSTSIIVSLFCDQNFPSVKKEEPVTQKQKVQEPIVADNPPSILEAEDFDFNDLEFDEDILE